MATKTNSAKKTSAPKRALPSKSPSKSSPPKTRTLRTGGGSSNRPNSVASNRPSKTSTTSKPPSGSDNSGLSSEARGTNGDDVLKPEGNMPNLLEAFGGDDQIWMRGSGESQVNSGAGDDLIGVDGKSGDPGFHQTKIDGGEGRDAIFAGSDFSDRPFHVTNEKGETVARNGEGGDQIQIRNVESVHARTRQSGTDGADQITSDLQTGDTGVRVNENHSVFGQGGDDQITVNTGDNGSSDVSIWGGEGNNQVQFNGGAAGDRVFYTSERNKENPNAEGRDQVRLNGGEGFDEASISSTNYRVVGADGKVISEMGDGADQISVEDFERLTIHNGRGESGMESFDLYR